MRTWKPPLAASVILETTVAELRSKTGVVNPPIAPKNREYVVSIVALAVALVALGVSIWIAL